MEKHKQTISFISIAIVILILFYFGVTLSAEANKTEALREEVEALKLKNDDVQNYIDQSDLVEMNQLIELNERKISQMNERLSHSSEIEVRYGKILSYSQTDGLILDVKLMDKTLESVSSEEDTVKIKVPEEVSIYLIDLIGPSRAEIANLIELVDGTPTPQYEVFSFVYVNGQLIQIYQGQNDLTSTSNKNSDKNEIATYNFTESEYTYVSENFYYECKIVVNGGDAATQGDQNINKDFVSLNYTFDIVPKDKNMTFYDFKVDATLDSELIAMQLAPFGEVIKSYGTDDNASGADFGFGMPTFALSTGSVIFINLDLFNTIKENPEVLKKAINFDITWKGGNESITLPSDNVNVIIQDSFY